MLRKLVLKVIVIFVEDPVLKGGCPLRCVGCVRLTPLLWPHHGFCVPSRDSHPRFLCSDCGRWAAASL